MQKHQASPLTRRAAYFRAIWARRREISYSRRVTSSKLSPNSSWSFRTPPGKRLKLTSQQSESYKILFLYNSYKLVCDRFEANFGSQTVTFTFKCGLPEVHPGQIRVLRKGNKMEVLVWQIESNTHIEGTSHYSFTAIWMFSVVDATLHKDRVSFFRFRTTLYIWGVWTSIVGSEQTFLLFAFS